MSKIALCLDHRMTKDEDGIKLPPVTSKVYNHSKRMREKRAVLDGVALELRRIIGKPTAKAVDREELRLAA